MRVKIWGCRGSIPVATNSKEIQFKLIKALRAASGKSFATDDAAQQFVSENLPWSISNSYGGNTSCVEIITDSPNFMLCDLGSGLREFGQKILKEVGTAVPQVYNVFMSHLHWDHIMGFPFFIPAYIPGNKIRIHSCHPNPQEAFYRQQSDPCFPVHFDSLSADIEFVEVTPDQPFIVDGTTVTAVKQYHGGESYGYRFDREGRSVVYSTDSEHKQENEDEMEIFVELFKNADVVVFDAQYSLADTQTLKEDWGHSSNVIGVELCSRAKAKKLVLFHHEPCFDDETLHTIFQETIRYEEIMRADHAVEIISAYDGLEIST